MHIWHWRRVANELIMLQCCSIQIIILVLLKLLTADKVQPMCHTLWYFPIFNVESAYHTLFTMAPYKSEQYVWVWKLNVALLVCNLPINQHWSGFWGLGSIKLNVLYLTKYLYLLIGWFYQEIIDWQNKMSHISTGMSHLWLEYVFYCLCFAAVGYLFPLDGNRLILWSIIQ
jgi:hypothetical protein